MPGAVQTLSFVPTGSARDERLQLAIALNAEAGQHHQFARRE